MIVAINICPKNTVNGFYNMCTDFCNGRTVGVTSVFTSTVAYSSYFSV